MRAPDAQGGGGGGPATGRLDPVAGSRDQGPGPGDPVGILLLNLGGPWTLEDVRPFLLDLFGDREIIRFPGGQRWQGAWARLITIARAPAVRRRYAEIGGGSPLLDWTLRQAGALERRLNEGAAGEGFVVRPAMRYAPPRAAEALAELESRGCRRVVVLPLYPQECRATTGSHLHDLARAAGRRAAPASWIVIRSFHDEPLYIRALADRIREGLDVFPDEIRPRVVTLFSAHAIPLRLARAGDPYLRHVRETVELLVRELGPDVGHHRLAFQSRTGPVRWVGPGTDQVLRELGRAGERAVLVVPLSFVSDHIETLFEIDIDFARLARRSGIVHFHRSPSLNDGPDFIRALEAILRRALAEKRPQPHVGMPERAETGAPRAGGT